MLPDLIQDHMNLGLRITAGTCGRSSLIVNDCGIWGLPQSRPWLNDQSSEDHADGTGGLRPLHASDHRVLVAGPVDLEEGLAVDLDDVLDRHRRERRQAHRDAVGSGSATPTSPSGWMAWAPVGEIMAGIDDG